MNPIPPFAAFLFFLLIVPLGVSGRREIPSDDDDPCISKSHPDPRTLRSDQITVLVNGYSETRLPLLQAIAAAYAASPLVAAVLVLWGNPSTSPKLLSQLSRNLTASAFGTAAISLVRQPSDSLNLRFLPRPALIRTRSVLICDDDVEVDPKSFEFAFRVWGSNRDRIVGPFVRSHDMDLTNREWIYTVHPDKYSMVLTKFMILKSEYLWKYSCGGGGGMEAARRAVEERRNCEDILMNFVAAEETGAGPVMVGAEKVRDWGDARNEEEGLKEMGLSSRRGEHRKRRGGCLTDFHRLLGKMPLRYSYGKVVNSVGEQGMCRKGGKLVLCDHSL